MISIQFLVIFKLTLVNGDWSISCEIALRWMPLDLTDDKSTLVQVMAWCRQATNHYLGQCWPRSMPPNGVTRSQWVNSFCLGTPYGSIDLSRLHCTTLGILVCSTSLMALLIPLDVVQVGAWNNLWGVWGPGPFLAMAFSLTCSMLLLEPQIRFINILF